MAHPNEELVRQGYAAFGKGDMDGVRAFFADDIDWHIPGNSQLAGDYHGIEAVMAFFGRVMEISGGTFRLEMHDVVAGDNHTVALVTTKGERAGQTLNMREAHIYHISDGKAAEFWAFAEDAAEVDRFFG